MKSLLDRIGRERAHALMTEATHRAIAKAHAHGLAVTINTDGELRRIEPGDRTPGMTTQDDAQKPPGEHGDRSN
ncbi:hypothetical protein QRO11_21085 [Paracidovorax citrulli]|uniref:DUF2188 domain-containing protein n=1 Tax=Paracidovorax citrulli TaxID=80869 RepID=A0ABY9APC5_PARCI|nr:hypothetical protein [Paracidovorax citrulli]MVT29679.1 hypothetical protein [Paracidovorax citrulli]PVY65180.1 hypothetical protein C8E08_2533 [Paracidovorax citrulli]QCX11078.1 hypothetical protein APS58_2246 [Paracidovorax citrulli]REG70630.1 hypothetical protein C8E07_3842 [Paracidovorax citrulli]RLJ95182.1 hypothetical protein C8E06_3837 [Paracidovorax citrulli]